MGDLYIETPIGSAKCKLKEVGGALKPTLPCTELHLQGLGYQGSGCCLVGLHFGILKIALVLLAVRSFPLTMLLSLSLHILEFLQFLSGFVR